jgi:ABC-type phosphate transport system permease subunit
MAVLTIVLTALLGAVVIHFTEDLGWDDAFYWAFVTCSSVGYGDISLTKDGSKIFCIFYMLVAVALFGISVGQFATIFMEMEQHKAIKRFIKKGVTEVPIALTHALTHALTWFTKGDDI